MMRYWALYYVNGGYWIGRFDGYWTRSASIETAALFMTRDEALNAEQALRAWFHESTRDKQYVAAWVYDVCGGLIQVREIERIYRVVPADTAIVAP